MDTHESLSTDASSTLSTEIIRALAVDALAANEAYQQELQQRAFQLDRTITRITRLKENLLKLIEQEKLSNKHARASTTKLHPYFIDKSGDRPSENSDIPFSKMTQQLYFNHRKWTDKEREALAHAVRAANKKLLLDSGKPHDMVSKVSPKQLEMNTTNLPWPDIAKEVKTRSSIECLIQWVVHDHPMINKTEWTVGECERLRSVVERHGGRDWGRIAVELGTNRTASQCFQQWQARMNKELARKNWTEEEDKILREAVATFGERNWQQVALVLDGRTGQQCLHRWLKSLSPGRRRGRWSPEEDAMLRHAVEVYGSGNWIQIQQHVPGRTDVQCRERWMNVLHPDVNLGPWTAEEDEKLQAAVAKYGTGKWSLIASEVPNRTDNQCLRRHKYLRRLAHPEEAPPRRRAGRRPKRPREENEGVNGERGLSEKPQGEKRKRGRPRRKLPEPENLQQASPVEGAGGLEPPPAALTPEDSNPSPRENSVPSETVNLSAAHPAQAMEEVPPSPAQTPDHQQATESPLPSMASTYPSNYSEIAASNPNLDDNHSLSVPPSACVEEEEVCEGEDSIAKRVRSSPRRLRRNSTIGTNDHPSNIKSFGASLMIVNEDVSASDEFTVGGPEIEGGEEEDNLQQTEPIARRLRRRQATSNSSPTKNSMDNPEDPLPGQSQSIS
ncbi:uncharacterized protein VTP21DRAFT_9548 [Calcarisporiella thermophila]|uniref:uncharacterized protein n=1 Tax=Calcarisporiella thermophila TaxID=911321 RepID=UPI0037445D51